MVLDFKTLEINKESIWALSSGVKVKQYGIPSLTGCSVGIDPGRNFGVTLISPSGTHVLWGTMPSQSNSELYGVWAINLIKWMRDLFPRDLKHCAVEGPAFGAKYNREGLAEIRFGFWYGLYSHGYNPIMVPPMTARKAATGSGRVTVAELLPDINPNAADSLGVALYALKLGA